LSTGRIAAAYERFSGIRQVTPVCTPPNNASLGLPESKSQTASRSVQPFLHTSRQSVPIRYNGTPFPPSKLALPMGGWTSSDRWFLGPIRAQIPNGISIGSAVSEGLTTVADRPTDRRTDHDTISV